MAFITDRASAGAPASGLVPCLRLIATDLDGTALNGLGRLSPQTRQAFACAAGRGIAIAAATGRALCALPQEIASCPHFQYALTSNGAAIYRLADRKCLYRRPLSEANLQALLALLRRFPVPAEVFIGGAAYADAAFVQDPASFGASGHSIAYVQATRTPCRDIPALIAQHSAAVEGMDFVFADMELKQEVRRQAETIPDLYVTSSVPHYLEFAAGSTNKQRALAHLARLLGVRREEILAFGDGENDLEMLSYAGTGVAMGNSSDHLKRLASLVAPSNTEDGVARTIFRLLGQISPPGLAASEISLGAPENPPGAPEIPLDTPENPPGAPKLPPDTLRFLLQTTGNPVPQPLPPYRTRKEEETR